MEPALPTSLGLIHTPWCPTTTLLWWVFVGALWLPSAGPETTDPGKLGERWEEGAGLLPEVLLNLSEEAK